jgi:hypothetical protein
MVTMRPGDLFRAQDRHYIGKMFRSRYYLVFTHFSDGSTKGKGDRYEWMRSYSRYIDNACLRLWQGGGRK